MRVSLHLVPVKNAMEDCRRHQLRERAIESPKMTQVDKKFRGHRPIVSGRWYGPKPDCDRRRRRTFRSYKENGTAWGCKPGHDRTHSSRLSPA